MFVDRAIVNFTAGKGGDGCVSFRREKFVPRGGPNGGDGGNGGDIVLMSDSDIHSLVDFKFRKAIRSESGKSGGNSLKTGKSGEDIVLRVPIGTIVKTFPDEKLIFDFSTSGQELVIAKGGSGGWGNARFKSSVQQAPRKFLQGKKGESIKVVLDLKLIAFAGLVGLPNAGKSTLISKISNAKPKIADYPFTTITPNLGVVYRDYDSLVLADIPGIIEGAHHGTGMGSQFLKHIERTKVLVYILDIMGSDAEGPLDTLKTLQNELKCFKSSLLTKKQMVVLNKIDLNIPDTGQKKSLAQYCKKKKLPYIEISALTGENLEQFKHILFDFYNEK